MKSKLLFRSLLLVLLVGVTAASAVKAEDEVVLYLFWAQGCPHCEEEKLFLEGLSDRYPKLKIKDYEVAHNQENASLFSKMAKAYGKEARGVPTTFLDGEVWIGYSDQIGERIEEKVKYCIQHGCIDPIQKLKGDQVDNKDSPPPEENIIEIPFFGEIDISSMSTFIGTVLISFVDGFNPCSLWVLTFLLGIVAHSRSRRKILAVGLTFLFVTASTYGLFILGVFSAFQYIGKLFWIRIAVSTIAFIFGVVNIKDYFWYKKGVSFTIPDRYRPKIFQDIRNIMSKGQSAPATLLATATMALGVTLVELPCTAGFPVMWTGMLTVQNVAGALFGALFVLYMIIYLLDELLVFGTVCFTLKVSKFEEKHGRLLKLIGGTIMLALAVTFLFTPELMNQIEGLVIVFGTALVASLILVLVQRKILPSPEQK